MYPVTLRVCFMWHNYYYYLATLKDVRKSKVLLHQRSEQLKQRQKLYQWQKFPEIGIPSAILDTGAQKELPADEQFGKVKNFDYTTVSLATVAKLKFKGFFTTVDDLRDYEEIADALGRSEKPLYQAGRWTTDVEFGRQMLNGVNPIIIEKCVTVPSNFPVTNDMVKPFLVRGLSLEEEMKVKNRGVCIIISLWLPRMLIRYIIIGIATN